MVYFIFPLGKAKVMFYMCNNGSLYKEHRRKDSISGFWSQIWPEDLLLTCSIIPEEIPTCVMV